MAVEFDLVVRGGTVVTSGDTARCDIGVRDGRIVALGERLGEGAREIDVTGRLVLPGGVDAHCHMDQPQGPGLRMADDFESGTRSAACGGTTTVIPFAAQAKGKSLREAVEDYHRRAAGKASVDYAFHMIVTDPTPVVLNEELPELVSQGCTSFKIYMTYDDLKLQDRQILDCLAVARREGALTMIHAENADCIAWLTQALEAAGLTAPKYHATARPPVVEREATHRALSLAELVDVPILIVHVSGADAIEQIGWAQARGLKIHAETCPQYITLTAQDMDLEGFEGAKLICSPPPRDEASHEAVWRGLESGLFQVFSSDHAPFRYDDVEGKKFAGEQACFHCVPNGIPGLETRLAILFSEGVMKGRIDLNRFVSLTSSGPARLYGLYPRKGTIAVGADADLAIWDADHRWTVTNDKLHHAVDYTPYEGMELQGRVMTTILRGEVVWDGGLFHGQAGNGRFLPRDRPCPRGE
ncbi:dihydropyrimidinase [Devosia limi DSM 17137]|uniref:Dihydropyrimidinase n=1 Tax=Devosia limi DSM 17137 TaxID=1121477 RepID=A0A0F5LUV6_9HYPH|nr:dihydropyrimidinase [Devosia limi]KKB86108.1 dihydropyrimidinase [Devosia limi DSM 17137]SHF85418.1 dihydropyrimidinase [Devosia limi DSM 17137]